MMKNLYDKWSFVEKDSDQEHWFIKLSGGKYHGVVYKYDKIQLIDETESINFDYEVVDWLDNNPEGVNEFNELVGNILKHVLEDALKHDDYIVGEK
jgi:hypothetical protein